jgi:hypothetical protein
MDHLAVANLLEGRAQKAVKVRRPCQHRFACLFVCRASNFFAGCSLAPVQMLRRIYDLQKSAHGPNDPRTMSTRQKIMTIRGQQIGAVAKDIHSPGRGSQHVRVSQHRGAKESKPPQSSLEYQAPKSTQPQGSVGTGGERSQPLRQSSEGSRCVADPRGSGSSVSNGSNSGKVTSVFKAIRSLGRKNI